VASPCHVRPLKFSPGASAALLAAALRPALEFSGLHYCLFVKVPVHPQALPDSGCLLLLTALLSSAATSLRYHSCFALSTTFFNFFQKFVVAYYRSQFVCGEIHYNTIRIYLSMPIFIYFTFCCTASLRQKLQRNKAEFFQYALDSICDIIMLIKPRKDSAVLCI
jgi:hypothetical protein